MKKAVVIGSGFAGMSAASFLARDGWEVILLEKHDMPGGRARQFKAEGFTFDMGPSWYWMPDVFEHYFNSFGKKVADYYELVRLDPSYRVYWPDGPMDIPADYPKLKLVFENIEPGAGAKLDQFMAEAAFKYEVGINKLVQKPGRSLSEFLDIDLAKGVLKLDVFTSMKKHVGKYFKHTKLRQLMEFPVLFLGAMAENIPALYSLMNYADIKLGTWYPKNGMFQIVAGMHSLASQLGVQFHFNSNVVKFNIADGIINGVIVRADDGKETVYDADVVIAGADYNHVEQHLLPAEYRSYSKKYWETRVMAPSSLLYFVGLKKKLSTVIHHALFFDVDFGKHADEIYKKPDWPSDPLFYVSATSVTDKTAAPEGCENLFFLVPVASGLTGDTEELRNKYFYRIVERFEALTGEQIAADIVYKRSYAIADFKNDYNAFKGNAYGLANTLMQTAILKPAMKSKKINNLYYTGQLTVPGPGVPPSLISGEVVAREINKDFKN